MRAARRLACLSLLVALPLAHAGAQFGAFGQNKIQYQNFDWHVLKGEHVDVYYYPAEERIARLALAYTEESYQVLASRFSHEVRSRIPLIIYASHTAFEQTNILPFVPEEGILGVTEYLRRRVTIPFNGSYSDFRHTLRHELTHVFQVSLESQQSILYPRSRGPRVPLWWSEGLAEYYSSEQDSRDNMVVRDLSIAGRMPSIDQLNATYSPIVYPLGGELHHFLAARYGEWRIPLLYRTLWKYTSFDDAMRAVYGRSVARLNEEWHYDLQQRFFPQALGQAPITLDSRRLAELAVKPFVIVGSDSSAEVGYISPSSGYTSVYRVPARGVGRPHVIVQAERSPEFESLHEFQSRMDARNGVLIFGSKFGERDALFFVDAANGRVRGRYEFDGIQNVLSPAWSPDGQRVAFSGLGDDGVSNLYVFEMRTHTLTRLTDDRYEDLDPTWLPDGRSLVFASDRGAGGAEGSKNLFRIVLESRNVTPLTNGVWNDETPRWAAGLGRVLFSSDRSGIFSLYSVDTLGNGRRETARQDALFDPSPIPGDSAIVAASFHDLSWDIFRLRPDSAANTETFALAPRDSAVHWDWSELASVAAQRAPSVDYHSAFSLDFAAGGTASGFGGGGGQAAEAFFSDLLGDRILALSLESYQTGGASDLLTNLSGQFIYLNQRRRVNWGVGVFRSAGTFSDFSETEFYSEKTAGVLALVRYPFSRFMRVEGQVSAEYSDRTDFASEFVSGPPHRVGLLTGNYLSLVGDNTLWVSAGPIDGTRWNLTGGVISDLSHGRFENWLGQADVRRYFRTSLRSAVAVRGLGYISEGVRPRAINIGGSYALRGYPLFNVVGTRAWLLNTEFRFPLANFIALGFPFGVISFPQLQGAFFSDVAQAWSANSYNPRVLGSLGVGLRVPLFPGFVLRTDIGKRFSFRGVDDTDASREFYRDRFVDFFLGYDF